MATSLPTHKTNRAAAGAAYAAAAAAYVNAYVELAAYDMTVSNTGIGGSHTAGFGDQPKILGHAEFLRDVPTAQGGDIAGRIRTRFLTLLAS